ncbi:MAG: GTPase domain-containing protein [Gammaproteobacteria bacterium]
MEECLAQLLKKQQEGHKTGEDDIDHALVLTEALAHYNKVSADCGSECPLNVVVVGPTQSGKSTTINWLTGTQAAKAEALAGYTRHAQGFITVELLANIEQYLEHFFNQWERVEQSELTNQELSAWSITRVDAKKEYSQPIIFWDTPDFDSISSKAYRTVALKLLAFADVIVFMVSKEKYADQTVWDTLKIIQPLHTPLLICLNKTPQDAANEILPELDERLSNAGLQAGVINIPYLENTQNSEEHAQRLREALKPLLKQCEHRDIPYVIRTIARQHWKIWTVDAYHEIELLAQWQATVAESLDDMSSQYETDYLQGPLYEGTLQKAMVRLLELIEVPGLAAPLVHARKALTWPARKIRAMFAQAKLPVVAGAVQLDKEKEILQDELARLLVSLQHHTGKQLAKGNHVDRQWWKNLFNIIDLQSDSITRDFSIDVDQYQMLFQQQIDAAADELYAHLQENPAKLNGLRMARVTTDAAAVVIALKTGGIGLNDLVLTPAMLSFVSMLTEGALGQYMQGVERKLKKSQKEAVCNLLITKTLQGRMNGLQSSMSQKGLYNLSLSQLSAVEKELGLQDG